VAVITDSLARRYWPAGDDPIGDTLRFRFSGTSTEVEVVGIVASLRHDSLDRGARDELFMPLAQMPFGSMTFVVRSATDASTLVEPARAAIWSVNPAQTIYRSATLDELVLKTVSPRRFALLVIVGFAVLAMVLAIAGVYSVLSAVMSTRVRELGVRVALGASRADIVRMVVGRGLMMAGLGVVIGVLGSLGAARLLQAFLFGITPADPVVVAGAVALMTLAAATACYFPARRAAGADPIAVLRIE
jgi:predicted lysophospholipase L1 biosynthesis ABC-type transport system permease subunit